MSPNWLIAGSPLVLLGVPLVLFADRNLDHQRQNMREGKEFLWQERFRDEIGALIHELDQAIGLSDEIVDMKDEFHDPSVPDPEGVHRLEDIPTKILQEAPFTPTIREVTDSMGSHSQKITELEQNYQDLEGNIRMVGLTFIAVYGVLAAGQLQYGSEIPGWLYLGAVLVFVFGLDQGWKYISKKRELREYADKYENHREI